jgi:mannitol-1-phosphate 5-dehydrogenase
VSVDVLVEPFYEWVVDASQIKGVRPDISGVTYVEDPLPYIERKLLTVNTDHSAIAYLGYARGRETIHAALEDDDVRDAASKALEETGLLLAREYGFDHPQDEEAMELQETIHAEGERAALAHYATIAEDHPLVDLVMERSDRIRE